MKKEPIKFTVVQGGIDLSLGSMVIRYDEPVTVNNGDEIIYEWLYESTSKPPELKIYIKRGEQ